MANSTKIGDYVFHHNSEYDGDVTIIGPDGKEFTMPWNNIFYFFTEYCRDRITEHVENAIEDARPSRLLAWYGDIANQKKMQI